MNETASTLLAFALIPGGLPNQGSDLVVGAVSFPKPDWPKLPKFHCFDCDDPALDVLVTEALGVWGQSTALGRSQKDITIRTEAIRYLLAAMVAQGPSGLPVIVAVGSNKLTSARYPKGHVTALEHLLAGGWIANPVAPNPTGSWLLFDASNGAMAPPQTKRSKRGKGKGSGGGYCLTEKAWDLLHSASFDPRTVILAKHKCLIVKDSNKVILDQLPDHPLAATWVDQVHAFNVNNRRFDFTLDGQSLAHSQLDLCRVFNHGGYEQGGRLYSQFINRPSDERERLMIDGQKVISIDFKNLHARLTFAALGLPCPNGDLYLFRGFDRVEVKNAWSAALNANNKTGFTDSQNSKPIIKAILAKYPDLKQLFGRSVGLKFQRMDSEIVSHLICAFLEAGRPLVPIHDGFLLMAQDQELMRQSMPKAVEAGFKQLAQGSPTLRPVTLPLVCTGVDWSY
jgi:hypothetical protein